MTVQPPQVPEPKQAVRRHTWLGGRNPLARAVGRPLASFLEIEAAGGILLMIAAVLALVVANSPWSDTYFDFWLTEVNIEIGEFHVEETLVEWVNDGLMAIFFFVVGLEIKRELVAGQLRDRRAAVLPAIAALGGMIVPAAFYLAFNAGGAGEDGWGIPMATDIAFALGVIGLLGSRVPGPLKVFLLTLAIVDDIGAIVVIAVFYTEDLSFGWLVLALGSFLVMALVRRMGVRPVPVYVVIGFAVWFAMLESGVHATIAGVIIGLLAPAKPLLSPAQAEEIVDQLNPLRDIEVEDVRAAEFLVRESVSVAERLEKALHPYTSYLIIPLFAFANAGIELSSEAIEDAASSPVTLGIIAGLVVGKTVGVAGTTLLAQRLGWGRLTGGVTNLQVVGIAVVSGVGFTVSLFIAGLAFSPGTAVVDEAKIGILAASVLAALLGAAILHRAGRDRAAAGADDDLLEVEERPSRVGPRSV